MKDNSLKPEPFHRGGVCWLSTISSCGTLRFAPWHLEVVCCNLLPWGPLQKLFLLKGYFCKGSPLRPFCIAAFYLSFCLVGLLGLHFLSFWPCGPSFPFILALWAFISFHFGLFRASFWGVPPTSCQKWSVFPISHTKNLAAPRPAPFSIFWPSGASFSLILALWAFISFHFGLVGFHFLAFWPFPGQLLGVPPHKLPKMVRFPNLPYKEFSSAETGSIFHFLAFWGFISFYFGLVGLHFLSF